MAIIPRQPEQKITCWASSIRTGGAGWRSAVLPRAGARSPRYILADQGGAALLFALLVVIVLATAIFAFSDTSLLNARVARNFRDGVQAFYLARSGVEYAIALLMEDDNDFDTLSEEWAQGPHQLEFEDGSVELRIQDEERKLNLNLLALGAGEKDGGSGEIFERLFDELGISKTLVPYLGDWMDPDDEEAAPGAEGEFYEALPRPYPVKNAPMDTLSELAAVGEAGDEVFEKLGIKGSEAAARIDENPYLTVRSSLKVNVNTANAAVLAALSASISEDVAKKIVSYREIHPFEQPSDLKDLPVVRDVFGDIQDVITTQSTNFLIIATADVGGVVKRIRAHIERLKGEVTIQYWSVD